MPFMKINELDMYYELHGSGEPMVLINGLKADHTGWSPVMEELAKNYQVLIFDNRGAGQTKDSGKSFTVDVMANDTMTLIKTLELEKPYIIGHSLGGAVAQTIAKKYEDEISKVVLCNTFMKFNNEATNGFKKVLELHEKGVTQAEIMESIIPWVFSKSFITPEIVEYIRKVSNENPHPQSVQSYRNQFSALINFDSSQWVHSIAVPTLIIGSNADITADPIESQSLACRIPGAELHLLPGGHASTVEQPQMLGEIIKNYCQPSFSLTNTL